MDAKDTVDTLNGLIEVSKDGEYGFRTSAEHAHDAPLRQLLMRSAAECAQAARELQDEVDALGGEAEEGGSAAGAIHRGWVSVKAKLSTFSDREILEEVERGEDKALNRYLRAAESDLPASALSIVLRQLEGVRRKHDQFRELREEARASSDAS
jgi:uncharacterized protein (TIGR02284 family)